MWELIQWDERGLIPAIVQDAASKQVLMMAYMNADSLRRTLDTGETVFWSRSRGELWHKGATSGNTQRVVSLHPDCDGDVVLALVEPAGPACHTGAETCFGQPRPASPLAALGEGCWWNDAKARVSTVNRLGEAAVLTTDSRFTSHADRGTAWRELASQAHIARGWSDCYGYLAVATGRAEAMVDAQMTPWDAAALMPVIIEAGGVITDWTGRVTAFGDGIVATNSALASDVRRILRVPVL